MFSFLPPLPLCNFRLAHKATIKLQLLRVVIMSSYCCCWWCCWCCCCFCGL